MPKVRDVLSHICVVTTKERRKCARNVEHRIPRGSACLLIKAGPTNSKLSYCMKCGQEILLTATHRLRAIEARLDEDGPALSCDPPEAETAETNLDRTAPRLSLRKDASQAAPSHRIFAEVRKSS